MAKSSEDYTAFIAKELKAGNVKYLDVASLFCAKFRLTRRSFDKYWKIANEKHSEFIEKRETKINEATIHNTIENLSNGLKSKSERLMNLQRQIDDLQAELEKNIMHVHAFSMGEMVMGTRPMNSLEKAKIADTIKGLQSEISKIEGDYAATKQDVKLTESFSIKDALKDFMNK